MIFYTTKKAILIYLLISSIATIFFSYNIFASEDVATFCFEANINLSKVENDISFLLADKDKVQWRSDDHCIDVVTSETKAKLIEKYLNKNYKLKNFENARQTEEKATCQLKMIETKKKKINTVNLNVGNKNNAKKIENDSVEKVESQILLSSGKAGALMVENKTLDVLCIKKNNENFLLKFYYSDKNKSAINSEVELNAGEKLNVGKIKKELDNKLQTLGIPQTTVTNEVGFENAEYELIVQ